MKKTIAGLIVCAPLVLYLLGEEPLRKTGDVGVWVILYGFPIFILLLLIACRVWMWAIDQLTGD